MSPVSHAQNFGDVVHRVRERTHSCPESSSTAKAWPSSLGRWLICAVLHDGKACWWSFGATHSAIPGLRRSERPATLMARRPVDAQPMMKQGIRVGFLESSDSLVCSQSRLTKPLNSRLGKRALVMLAVCLDLRHRVDERRRNLTPLVLGQHRHVHPAAPAVNRSWHGCCSTMRSASGRTRLPRRLVEKRGGNPLERRDSLLSGRCLYGFHEQVLAGCPTNGFSAKAAI